MAHTLTVNLMELKHIKGIGPSKQQKLKAAGIDSVTAMARADVAAVAAKSGLPVDTVKEYKQKAAALALLEDIKGMGPATLATLAEAGVASLKDLANASSKRLATELKVAQHQIQDWQVQAKKAAERIAKEAQTPEGRAKLVKESKAMAIEGAEKAQAAAKDAIAYAQKESKVLAAKAKDFQAQAPKYVEKAQVALKDVQTKAKTAADKAAVTVKHEAEKVKAQTEKVVADTKRRLIKAK